VIWIVVGPALPLAPFVFQFVDATTEPFTAGSATVWVPFGPLNIACPLPEVAAPPAAGVNVYDQLVVLFAFGNDAQLNVTWPQLAEKLAVWACAADGTKSASARSARTNGAPTRAPKTFSCLCIFTSFPP
jgi:hypothetical protein